MIRGPFFDTSVPLHLLSEDSTKAGRAEDLLASGGTISVQVLNEFAAVARRTHKVPWTAIEELLAGLRLVCRVAPLTVATHERAVALAKRHGFHIYEATIAASAIEAGCETLYSEDLQHGQVFDGLTVLDPFR